MQVRVEQDEHDVTSQCIQSGQYETCFQINGPVSESQEGWRAISKWQNNKTAPGPKGINQNQKRKTKKKILEDPR